MKFSSSRYTVSSCSTSHMFLHSLCGTFVYTITRLVLDTHALSSFSLVQFVLVQKAWKSWNPTMPVLVMSKLIFMSSNSVFVIGSWSSVTTASKWSVDIAPGKELKKRCAQQQQNVRTIGHWTKRGWFTSKQIAMPQEVSVCYSQSLGRFGRFGDELFPVPVSFSLSRVALELLVPLWVMIPALHVFWGAL